MARRETRGGGRRAGGKNPRTGASRRTGSKPPVRRSTAASSRKQRRDPETLRLRSVEPALTVDDIERSLRFYTDVLGFVVGERWEEGGQLRGVSLKAGACSLGLSQDDWSKGRDRKKGEGISLWCGTAQDIDALAARIKAAGARLAQEPSDSPEGGRMLAVDDPDGFRLRLYKER
jgi:catechol 2,3-dioxygenase-like lactoylglutathione lyase family enzyme